MISVFFKIVVTLIVVQIALFAVGSVFVMVTSLRDRRSNKREFAEIRRIIRLENLKRETGSKTRLVSFETRPDK